jgi:hypothetical protein
MRVISTAPIIVEKSQRARVPSLPFVVRRRVARSALSFGAYRRLNKKRPGSLIRIAGLKALTVPTEAKVRIDTFVQ